ncbi:death-associated protein 1-like [Acanthaster planci]|uniref:Death-associated protein 1-like n=1 Tax=Acanthaster planci TaxID=133434 RepID=A0A8B7YN91_ACAPL|nr:death-associated protein 1-like [Acanthaster planci]
MGDVDDKELKAGHPPAVKAGGMRIKQSGRHPHEKPQEMTPEEEEEYGPATSPPKPDVQVMISGVPSRGNKDFPPDAIRVFHEKPMPSHQKSPNTHHPVRVQQPRK